MEKLSYLQQQLGLMTWPLLICSALTVLLIVERLIQVTYGRAVPFTSLRQQLRAINPHDEPSVGALAERLAGNKNMALQGVSLLILHRGFAKPLREEVASMWLEEQRQQLNSGLRLLNLIGVVSPLIGLLGTVLGLIEMFQGVAAAKGNITPNDLASGLGVAMRTTAAGLVIALPAIAGAQLLGLWADRAVSKLEHSLNFVNLWLEGVTSSWPQKTAPRHVHAESRV